MTANEAMLRVAKAMADKYGFVAESENTEINARDEKFWGNMVLGIEAEMKGEKVIVMSSRYVLPEPQPEGKPQPKIDIDMFWGQPRLSVRLPDGTFACLAYKDNEMYDAQAFHHDGLRLALTLQFMIDEEMKKS